MFGVLQYARKIRRVAQLLGASRSNSSGNVGMNVLCRLWNRGVFFLSGRCAVYLKSRVSLTPYCSFPFLGSRNATAQISGVWQCFLASLLLPFLLGSCHILPDRSQLIAKGHCRSHEELSHLLSEMSQSHPARLGMCILYNWDLFINNGNIMARPHYLLLSGTRDCPTYSSQSRSQDFWCFV